MSLTGRIGRALALGLVAVGFALGGCQNVSKGEYNMVIQENQTLRDTLEKEKQARTEAETRNSSLEQENRDLMAQLDKSRGPGFAGASGGKGAANLNDFSGEGIKTSTRGSDLVVSVAGDVLFDSGSATLKSSAKKTLDHIASTLKSKYSAQTIRVEGYTDNDPLVKTKEKWKTNERLSGERAMAVEDYLSSKGIPKNKIYFAGFGPDRQMSSKKESRRVEIVILAGAN